MRKYISVVLALVLSFTLYSCGNSNVGGGAAANDVAFDPSKASNLEVVHYNVVLNRLQVDLGLPNGSAAINLLNQQQNLFRIPNPRYTSTYAVQYTNIFNLACRDMDETILFPEGADLDHAWETITGKEMDAASKKLETDVLAEVSGEAEDVQIFALCFALMLDANSMFINFVAGE